MKRLWLYTGILVCAASIAAGETDSVTDKESAMSGEGATRLWDQEPSLWEAAQSVTISQPVPPADPQPVGIRRAWAGTAVDLSASRLRVSLWGPPHRPTLSLLKPDVWDRRFRFTEPLTLAEIKFHCMHGRTRDGLCSTLLFHAAVLALLCAVARSGECALSEGKTETLEWILA